MRKIALLLTVLMMVFMGISFGFAQEFSLTSKTAVTAAEEGFKSVNGKVVSRYYVIRIGNTIVGELRENSLIQSSLFGLWARDAAVYTRSGDSWSLEIFSRPANKEEAEIFQSKPPESWYSPRFYNKATVKTECLPVPLNSVVLDISSIYQIVHYKEGGIKLFLANGTSSEVAEALAEKIRNYLSNRQTS